MPIRGVFRSLPKTLLVSAHSSKETSLVEYTVSKNVRLEGGAYVAAT